jgi:hypothetical protein
MVISLFTRRRRALALLVLAAASLALAFGAMLGAANQSAHASVRAHARHAVHHTQVRFAGLAPAAENPAAAESQNDAAGGANAQSGDQSAPDNATGAGTETAGESTTPEADGPGGANVGGDCTGACVQ